MDLLPLELSGVVTEKLAVDLSCSYNKYVIISFDAAKSRRNVELRGLPFEMVEAFDWSTCLVGLSSRQEPTATRFVAVGMIGRKVYVVVFTISDEGVRVISLRRASRRERQSWHASQILT